MPNDSSTGGPLQPIAPIAKFALRRLLGSYIVELSGIAPELVRPMWQRNPPPMPSADVNWISFGIENFKTEFSGFQDQFSLLQLRLITQSSFDVSIICYGEDSIESSRLIRDNIEIGQNREFLFKNNMAIADVSDIVHVPEFINNEFYDRSDFTIKFRGVRESVYDIKTFTSTQTSIISQRG
jgi:hypothetical protein